MRTQPPPIGGGVPFEAHDIGKRWRTQRRTITEHDLMTFTTTCGFNEALFMDANAPLDLGFKGRLIPGALTFSLAEGLVVGSGLISGTGLAFLGANMEIKRPVFVGDTIEVWIEVISAKLTSGGDRGVVETRNDVLNEDGECVLVYTPKRMIKSSSTHGS